MNDFHILVVDDEEAQRASIAGFLKKKGYQVATAASGSDGVAHVRDHHVDLVLSDYKMPDITGEEVLRSVHEINPMIPVVVITAYGSIERAVGIMKLGAFDYVQKPVDLDELLLTIERAREHSLLISENKLLRDMLAERHSFSNIISNSEEMEDVLNTAGRVAASKASVLIRGESGTGKELVARAIHQASQRNDRPFVVVNCAAITESLFESELFGHEKGAFTGADRQRIGEVGDIPLAIQVKLLRALQFGQIERVGGNETLELDVRIVAATNRDLEELMSTSEFREDLYYRLNVVTITIPPLRDRRTDIAPLTQEFIRKYSEANGKQVESISAEAMDALVRHGYPGNVRELENIIQRAVVMARDKTLTTRDLSPDVGAQTERGLQGMQELQTVGDLNKKVEQLEKSLIDQALVDSDGNQVKAAELLNISERTLRYKLSKYRGD
jgi:two-component system NtrC family response regulator